jgi:putative aldouronate transport system substrate-binding protein
MVNRTLHKIIAMATACIMLTALSACGPVQAPAYTGSPARTPTPTPSPMPEPPPVVLIHSIYPGEEPNALQSVMSALNISLEKDIAVHLELSWVPEESYDGAIATDVSSGKPLDFFWCESSKLAEYAGKHMIAPIDEQMAKYGQDLYKSIGVEMINALKIGGKLMGVPGAGGMQLAGAEQAFIFRADLQLKYALPKPDTIENIELFLGTIAEKEPGLAALSAGNAALAIMPPSGPEIALQGAEGTVAVTIGPGNAATCMPMQDAASFKGGIAKARAWFKAGWEPKDIVNTVDPKAAVAGGSAAATFGQALSLPQMQQAVSAAVPGAELACAPVPSLGIRYIDSYGGGALCVAYGSRNPDKAVQLWNWALAGQEHYVLFCYGKNGSNYILTGEKITLIDGGPTALQSKMFANAGYMRFPAGTSDAYIDAVRNWNNGVKVSPLMGFVFDGKNVQEALAKVNAVYSVYGRLLLTGSSNAEALLSEFGKRLKAAGQDAIVAEAQAQVNAFLAAK